MNFFDHQRAAKGTTLKLVFLFVAAVVALVAAIDGAAVLAMTYLSSDHEEIDASAILTVVIVVTAITLLVIGGGMLFKTLSLRQGGAAVAAAVGAEPVDPTTTDPQLRRFVNIVEEMALASGIPAPRLFVMPRETGINAFAAGFTPADAAIAVTGGALAQLNRDELQGVIGHEFSHILNGDMRLNIRLIGLLAGILLIGMIGLRSLQFGGRGSDSKGALPIVAFAFALMVLGFIGVFFANVIKAAVSRQREWLADASAVQFTRQTDGLEGALKKIGGIPTGSRLRDSRNAAEVSHMLFGEGARRSFASLFATHPQLTDRIKALNPDFDPREIAELQQRYAQQAPDGLAEDVVAGLAPAGTALGRPGPAPEPSPASGRHATSPERVVARVGTFTPADLKYGAALHAQLPDDVRQLATQPTTAPIAVIAMLLAPPGEPAALSPACLGGSAIGAGAGPRSGGSCWADGDAAARTAHAVRRPGAATVGGSSPWRPGCAGRGAERPRRRRRHGDDVRVLPDPAGLELPARRGRPVASQQGGQRVAASGAPGGDDPSGDARDRERRRPEHVSTSVPWCAAPPVRRRRHGGQPASPQLAADARRRLGCAGRPLEPKAKQALVEAMVESVIHDGTVTAAEAEMLRAACGLMHLPLPALLD